ncbi:MAG: hypothetical protein IJY50_00530 [Clostridia bacterium]|nr:hypothetical protein [Clostridia bacterium]
MFSRIKRAGAADSLPLLALSVYAREEHRLSVTVPSVAPDPMDTVVAVTLAETPRVQEL